MEIIFSGGKTWIITVYLCSLTNQEWQYVMADTCATYIKDELWPLEWYLNKSETDKYDMNVLPAWKSCVNGTGVTVGVVDKGIQDHFDLNINRAISFGDAKTGTINSFKHGTRVAGIIGALKNGNQTVGIAFGSEIADIKVASSSMFKTLDVEALTHHMNIIDVYSSSFANFHTGTVTYPLLTEQEESFKRGTKFGRGGLGSVYVFATGNSGGDDTDFGRDSCAYDRLVTNRYVISVAGIQNDLTKLPTGEFCSAMMVAAFTAKAGATHHKLVTTDIGNKSTEYFNQNSAATPMVSGAVVLALSANPRLSYRDVMHLLVLTCRGDLPEFEQGGNYFMKNAANLSVSSYFGFGLLDIGALVEKCKVWENVPQVMNCSASNNRRRPVRSNSHTVLVNMCNIHYVEHVEVSLKVQHRHAGQIQWVLISPYGTRSTVLPGRGLDSTREMNLTVLTVQMWGENPNGQWRLEPTAVFGSNLDNGTVELFSITIYGCTCIPGLKCLPPAKQVSPCDKIRCQNGAGCGVNSNGIAICKCKASFSGTYCEQSQCDENLCKNGGTCVNVDVDISRISSCKCKDTFSGKYCEHSVLVTTHSSLNVTVFTDRNTEHFEDTTTIVLTSTLIVLAIVICIISISFCNRRHLFCFDKIYR